MVRTLAFWDRFTQYLTNEITSDTEGDTLQNERVLPLNEKTSLVISVTGLEYTKMFSALMTGADLKFTDESHELTWLLWRAVKVPTFCEEVAACIANSPEVQASLVSQSIIDGSNSGAGNPETPLPDSVLSENMIPSVYTCDNDHRYGTSVGVVESIHSATVEIFQAIELLTNANELAAEIGDNFSLVQMVTSGLDVVVWIQNTIYEIYNSAYSPTVVDTISCEIYCKMQPYDPCHLDFDMIWDVYTEDLTDLLTPPPLSANWTDWFAWLVDITLNVALDATNTVKAGSLLGLLIMRYGGSFGQFVLGIRTLKTTIALLANDTNPDWAILCLDCPGEWEHTWNFETHPNAWTDGGFDLIPPVIGQYEAGIGVTDQLVGNQNGVAGLIFGLDVDASANNWIVYYRIVRGFFALNPVACVVRADPYTWNEWTQAHILTGDKKFAASWNGTEVTRLTTACYSSIGESDPRGSVILVGITISGDGSDPYAALDTGEPPY